MQPFFPPVTKELYEDACKIDALAQLFLDDNGTISNVDDFIAAAKETSINLNQFTSCIVGAILSRETRPLSGFAAVAVAIGEPMCGRLSDLGAKLDIECRKSCTPFYLSEIKYRDIFEFVAGIEFSKSCKLGTSFVFF